ncbi:MAG: type II toxin-antitoxin system Phd/YefM family antitoxin [bacterium]|nr:type II toxin-antitoxin system Phd/YefM family antitoxin [bacterium]
MATETLSLTELRPRLSEIIDRANRFFDRFLMTRHGRADAVLLASDDYEGLLETIDILADSECVKRLAEAEEEFARGGGHSLEAARRELRDAPGQS